MPSQNVSASARENSCNLQWSNRVKIINKYCAAYKRFPLHFAAQIHLYIDSARFNDKVILRQQEQIACQMRPYSWNFLNSILNIFSPKTIFVAIVFQISLAFNFFWQFLFSLSFQIMPLLQLFYHSATGFRLFTESVLILFIYARIFAPSFLLFFVYFISHAASRKLRKNYGGKEKYITRTDRAF